MCRSRLDADPARHLDREQTSFLRPELSSQFKSASESLHPSKSKPGILDQYLQQQKQTEVSISGKTEQDSSQRMKDSYVNSVIDKIQNSKSPLTKSRISESSKNLRPAKDFASTPQPQNIRYQYTPREFARMSAQPQLAFPSFGLETGPQNYSMLSKGASIKLNSTNNDSMASSKLRIKVNVADLAQKTCSDIDF